MNQFQKLRRKKIKKKFYKKNIEYKISESSAFILKPDNLFYGNFEIKNDVFLLE